jgi:hypothetical protein
LVLSQSQFYIYGDLKLYKGIRRFLEFPDLIQLDTLGVGVIAQVANQFAYVGPVLLFDLGAVVAIAGP